VKKIALTSQRCRRRFVMVDDEDFEALRKWVWYAKTTSTSKTIYAVRFDAGDGDHIRSIPMHREILGASNEFHVDHRDGNGLNNQRSNLRSCTRRQNLWNARKHMKGTSIYKGVSYDRRRGVFVARIHYEGKNISLGKYKDENAAGMAYNAAASRLFGEFAHLNKIRTSNRVVSQRDCSRGFCGIIRTYVLIPA
jgi:HNH endonuclease/AP2 domain